MISVWILRPSEAASQSEISIDGGPNSTCSCIDFVLTLLAKANSKARAKPGSEGPLPTAGPCEDCQDPKVPDFRRYEIDRESRRESVVLPMFRRGKKIPVRPTNGSKFYLRFSPWLTGDHRYHQLSPKRERIRGLRSRQRKGRATASRGKTNLIGAVENESRQGRLSVAFARASFHALSIRPGFR